MMRLFDMLDLAAEINSVNIQWIHDADDENLAELGEDLTKANFELLVKNS